MSCVDAGLTRGKQFVSRLHCCCVLWQSRRLAEYRSTKRTIINLSSEMEIPPSSQFEIEVVSGGDLFKPSAHNMEQLRRYSKEVLFSVKIVCLYMHCSFL